MHTCRWTTMAAGMLLTVSTATADIDGVVHDPQGRPVPEAVITDLDSGEVVIANHDGRFELPGDGLPRRIEVVHPSFAVITVTLHGQTGQTVTLQPRQIREEVTVTARTPSGGFSPVGAAATEVRTSDLPTPPTAVLDMVEAIPGVAENGQGGLFQVFSVRGVSRQRVLTQIAGMRITSERRAGVSASFLDPLLLEGVDVLRGPASSYYGSGALGGVVRLDPRRFDGPVAGVGYETRGHENFQMAGWGDDQWSVGAVRRDAGNATDPLGFEINSHFTQYSGLVSSAWERGETRFQLLVIPTLGRDIGKANTSFPGETTSYPEEKHLLTRFSVEGAGQWRLNGWLHPHDLHTRDLEPERQADVFNDTFDYGADFTKQWQLSNQSVLRLGADYFGRRGVDAFERRTSRETGETLAELQSLRDGEEDELGLHSSLRHSFGILELEGGGRFSWHRQENAGEDGISRAAGNGFAGASLDVGGGVILTGSVGTGLRFASLTERFFTGTTGRGEVIGNPDLDSERSLSLEGGVRWFGRSYFVSAYFFRNQINDYIERIEVQPDVLTFVNVTEGTIRGLEFETVATPAREWQVFFRGHVITGEDDVSDKLADIPANRFTLGTRFESNGWQVGGQWQYRAEKTLVGSGEKPIPSANVVSLYGGYRFGAGWTIVAALENALNEQYFNSADRRTPLAAERAFSIRLSWSPGS